MWGAVLGHRRLQGLTELFPPRYVAAIVRDIDNNLTSPLEVSGPGFYSVIMGICLLSPYAIDDGILVFTKRQSNRVGAQGHG